MFTVKLRPGVKWHDGAPFTARDVIFTWKTIMNPKVTAFSTVGFDQIADMWAADETTLKLKMKQPYAPIADILADMFIVPEHVLAKSADINKDEFNTRQPVGTGPFKFVSRAAGDHIALEANRAYHGPGPYLDRLIFKYVPDLTVLFTQLKTGRDRHHRAPGHPRRPLPRGEDAHEHQPPRRSVHLLRDRSRRTTCCRCSRTSGCARRSTSAMDKKPIVEKIWLGLAPEAESYVPPQSWAYNPKIKGRHKYDPERARKLLDEMGWKPGADGIRVKDGTRLSFENACTAGNKQREQIQQLLQQQWRQVGVEMKINNKPAAVLFGDFYRMSKFETILIGMAMGSDPEHSFRIHSKYIPAKGGMGRNSVAYESAGDGPALDAGVRDIDREKRKKAYPRAPGDLRGRAPVPADLPLREHPRAPARASRASSRTATCRSTAGTRTSGGSRKDDEMTTPRSQIIAVSDVAWQERGAGVRMKSLWEHPESKRRAVMTRIEPGAKLPLHRHDGDELVFVIEGAVADEFGTVTSGNMGYRPNGCVHTVVSPNGATLLAILTGGVDPGHRAHQRPPVPGHRAQRAALDGRATRRPAETHLGGQDDRAARAPCALRTRGHATEAPSRRRRAHLRDRRRERRRVRRRLDRQHELPSRGLRPHRDDPERRHGPGGRLGAHGTGLTWPAPTSSSSAPARPASSSRCG